MKIWYHNVLASQRFVADIAADRIRVGRGPDNDIVLDSPFIADQAAVLHRRAEHWELLALGMNGWDIDGEHVPQGRVRALPGSQKIRLFPFELSLCPPALATDENAQQRTRLDEQMSQLLRAIHIELLAQMDLGAAADERLANDEYLLTLERNLEEIARLNHVAAPANAALLDHIAGHCVRSALVERLINAAQAESGGPADAHWSRIVSAVPHREEELDKLIGQFGERLTLSASADLSRQMEAVERGFWSQWDEVAGGLFLDFRLYLAQRQLKKQIKDVVFGYGPLEDLLRMPTVTEIMVVSRDRIYIEKNGLIENSGRRFISDEVTLTIIERIVSRVGRRIDKSQPLVDARLADGSRVNAVIPPLAVSGPCLTIRKFPERRMRVSDLIARGTLTPTAAEFLRAAVVLRKNILIAGGTGSGKTTLLNCLSDFIPEKERIITIEDTAELQLQHEHVASLESKPANIEGSGAYPIRDLVKNALRMRPDRIVVGECRGVEALDMLQAMNTGHDGSLTTIHANTAADVVLRLEVVVRTAADLPLESIHRQIASAVDLIVQLSRQRDGSRLVTQIVEVVGVDDELGGVRLKELFALEGSHMQPRLCPTGRLPSFMDQLIERQLIDLTSFFRCEALP